LARDDGRERVVNGSFVESMHNDRHLDRRLLPADDKVWCLPDIMSPRGEAIRKTVEICAIGIGHGSDLADTGRLLLRHRWSGHYQPRPRTSGTAGRSESSMVARCEGSRRIGRSARVTGWQ